MPTLSHGYDFFSLIHLLIYKETYPKNASMHMQPMSNQRSVSLTDYAHVNSFLSIRLINLSHFNYYLI